MKNSLRTGSALVAAAVALVVGAPGPALAQCIMCRQALASPEGQRLIAAFQSGILVLLAAPIASFAAVAYLAVRRQRRLALADGTPEEGLASGVVTQEPKG